MIKTKKDLEDKYNELIKLSVKTMSMWKKGSYSFKAREVERCKKDIFFYKTMKKKLR